MKQRQKRHRKRTPNRHPVVPVSSLSARGIVMGGAIEYMLQREIDALLSVLPEDLSEELRIIWYGDPSVPFPQGEVKVHS